MRGQQILYISMFMAFAAACPNVNVPSQNQNCTKDSCDADIGCVKTDDGCACQKGERCDTGRSCKQSSECRDGEVCADSGQCVCPSGAACDGSRTCKTADDCLADQGEVCADDGSCVCPVGADCAGGNNGGEGEGEGDGQSGSCDFEVTVDRGGSTGGIYLHAALCGNEALEDCPGGTTFNGQNTSTTSSATFRFSRNCSDNEGFRISGTYDDNNNSEEDDFPIDHFTAEGHGSGAHRVGTVTIRVNGRSQTTAVISDANSDGSSIGVRHLAL